MIFQGKFVKLALLCLLPTVASAEHLRERKTLIGAASAGAQEASEFSFFSTQAAGKCGGSLISDTEVLTAAACVAEGAPTKVCIHALDQDCNDSKSISIGVTGAYINTNYDASKPALNNMAVIRLSQPCSEARGGTACEIMTLNTGASDTTSAGAGLGIKQYGLGSTTTDSANPTYPTGTLVTNNMQTITDADCRAVFGTEQLPTDAANEALFFCANNDGNSQGACTGDYGGPATTSTGGGSLTQVGIMVRMNDKCGDTSQADVHVDIAGQETWLAQAMSTTETNVDVESTGCCAVRLYRAARSYLVNVYSSLIGGED